MKHNIYLLHDNNGRVFYIGRTQYPLNSRLSGHRTEARVGVVNKSKCAFIIKMKFNIGIVLIEQADTIFEARLREKHWARFFSKFSKLYNVRPLIK